MIDQRYAKPFLECSYIGNPRYVAPEVLLPEPGGNLCGQTVFGHRRDIFSAGLLFAELLLGIEHLFLHLIDSEDLIKSRDHLHKTLCRMTPELALKRGGGDFLLSDQGFNRKAAALVAKMLTHDRFARPSPAKLLRDPFFSTS